MEAGDIIGHEFMGEVVETGPGVNNLKAGDRVVVPFPISCGNCFFCRQGLFSVCDNSNPNAWMAEKMWGHSPAGIFGYSHLLGGFAGGQAQYARVPFADVGPIKIENGFSDEQVLFLSDIFPTGYMAAELCNIKPGDTIAVWGCGPVGLFAIKSAFLLGAERVFAIDRFPERLRMAHESCGAQALNYEEVDVLETLKEATGGRGPDACIDAVGMEAHSPGIEYAYDRAKQAMMLETGRPIALRQAMLACRNGGTVSIPGVYGGFIDKLPFGSVMNRSITIRTGQTHVQRYLRPLLDRIANGEIDPSFVVSHRLKLDDARQAYDMFLKKQDDCIKVVMKPWDQASFPGPAGHPLFEEGADAFLRVGRQSVHRHDFLRIRVRLRLVEIDLGVEGLLADADHEGTGCATMAAMRRVAAGSSAAGTTWFTKPQSAAVRASTNSPVSSISIARLRPTARVRATIGVVQKRPIFTPGVAKRASSPPREIASGHQLAPRSRRQPLDLRDHRLRNRLDLRHQIRADVEYLSVFVDIAPCHLGQVVARAEYLSGRRKDDRPDFPVTGDFVQAGSELLHQAQRECIPPLWPVECNDNSGPLAADG